MRVGEGGVNKLIEKHVDETSESSPKKSIYNPENILVSVIFFFILLLPPSLEFYEYEWAESST